MRQKEWQECYKKESSHFYGSFRIRINDRTVYYMLGLVWCKGLESCQTEYSMGKETKDAVKYMNPLTKEGNQKDVTTPLL